MPTPFSLKANIALGVVPTHIRFAGGVAPDTSGALPRTTDGRLVLAAELARLAAMSPVTLECAQISYFGGAKESDMAELAQEVRSLGMELHLIMMVGGADPMNPKDEEAVVDQLVEGLKSAATLKVRHVSSTSIEEWMGSSRRLEGKHFQDAVEQNVRVHLRALQEAGIQGSSLDAWHIEFLRPGEFRTFTDLGRAFQFTQAVNDALGRLFFKVLIDAAHCGDSCLSLSENEEWIRRIAAAGQMGIFHASAKTTRGCLSTDDGWVGALLAAAAGTGQLEHVFIEIFDHEDPALAPLRAIDPRHGIDTRDGRSYTEVVVDAVAGVARRLNNLAARGILPSR